MAETKMSAPRGDCVVQRPHTPVSSPLRGWSAADQLVLSHLGVGELGRVLIVNDEFGALTCGLADTRPTVWGDSALSRSAIDANLVANGFPALEPERSIHGNDFPSGSFDTVVIRIPKTTALLEHQLRGIRSCLSSETKVVGAGMVRHVHTSTVDSFERLVGSTTTSRATRKARLLHSAPAASQLEPVSLGGSEFVSDTGLRVAEYPGTFSAGHLDVGSALLLGVLVRQTKPPAGAVVADLGCGNGVLAATMASQWPETEFVLLDVSDSAIAAASKTWELNDLGDHMTAIAADGFAETQTDSIDVVITNPPFHQGHAHDPDMTERLLAETARVLKPDGVAYVVVQRHLHLHTKMKRWFNRVDVESKHPTHVVLVARNPK